MHLFGLYKEPEKQRYQYSIMKSNLPHMLVVSQEIGYSKYNILVFLGI